MSLKQSEDKFANVISDALHEVTDKDKKKIDQQIAEWMRGNGFFYMECMELNLVTASLYLYESIEKKADRNIVNIRCVPSEDAFDRKIVLNGHILWTVENLLLDLLARFTVPNQEVMLSTKENNITVSGIYSILEYLNELCSEKDGEFVIEKNKNALALAYLKLNGCYIKEVNEEDRNMILIGFETE